VRQAAFVFLRAGLYNIHSSGTIANVQGEPAAHALRGAVQRAREQGRGRRGKPVLGIMFLMVFFPWLVTRPAKLYHGGP